MNKNLSIKKQRLKKFFSQAGLKSGDFFKFDINSSQIITVSVSSQSADPDISSTKNSWIKGLFGVFKDHIKTEDQIKLIYRNRAKNNRASSVKL